MAASANARGRFLMQPSEEQALGTVPRTGRRPRKRWQLDAVRQQGDVAGFGPHGLELCDFDAVQRVDPLCTPAHGG